MTETPYPFQQFPNQFQPPPPPPKKRHVLRWTLVGVAVLAVAIGVGAASGGSKHAATVASKPAHITATSSAAPATIQPPIVEPAGPVYLTPTKADFEVTLKILTKDCFGSAGCNVTYRPILAQYQPVGSFDPSITYDVTYVVHGGDDGAQTDTLYVTGDVHEAPNDGMAQTGSAGAKLTAVVTAVEAE